MPPKHANSEMVLAAWLKLQDDIPPNAIGTVLPQGVDGSPPSWASTGFLQVQVAGRGTSSPEIPYRAPVMTVHLWATSVNKQKPPWNQANDLAEAVWNACLVEGNGVENLTLPSTGAPKVRVLQVWGVQEPRRVPWGFPTMGRGTFINPGNTAHYTVDLQIAWAELP